MGEPPRTLLVLACLLAFSLPLGIAPAQIFLGLALAAGCIAWMAGRRFWTHSPVDLPLLVLIATGFLSAALSERPAASAREALSLWTLLPVLIAKEAASDGRAVRWLLRSLLAGALLAAACGILQAAAPGAWSWAGVPDPAATSGRATGFFSHPMTFAGSQSLLLVLFAAGLGTAPAWAGVAVVGALAAALVASGTRGAFVMALLALAALAALAPGPRLRLRAGTAAVVLLAIALAGGAVLTQRFAMLRDPAPGPGRPEMWLTALAMLRERPLTGVGPGGFRASAGEQMDVSRYRPAHAHSNLFEVAATRGMLGLAAYLLLWIAFFSGTVPRMWRMRARGDPRWGGMAGAVLGICVFLGVGMLEYNLGDSEVAMLAAFVAGLPFGRAFYGRPAA